MTQIQRSFTAWLAALALLFASATMPLLHDARAMQPAADQAAMANHDHGQPTPAADCGDDNGLCLNCALCNLQALAQPAALPALPPAALQPGKTGIEPPSHIAALPAEPPQI